LDTKDRDERNTPEIQRSDLAEVVLLLHSLGIREAASFDWLDKPDPQAVERAERLLTMLGALLDADLTPIGRQMLRLPMHPRYSRMLDRGQPARLRARCRLVRRLGEWSRFARPTGPR
jgi:ATP-dependent helicase HrpB